MIEKAKNEYIKLFVRVIFIIIFFFLKKKVNFLKIKIL